jgi:excisionase family DNA binding protein
MAKDNLDEDFNILDFNQAVGYLQISKSLLYKLTSKRTIKFFKPNGGKIYFLKSDLDAWILGGEMKSIDTLASEALNTMKGGRYAKGND